MKPNYLLIIDPALYTPEVDVYNRVQKYFAEFRKHSEFSIDGIQLFLPKFQSKRLPEIVHEYTLSGVICLGSAANVTDDHLWMRNLEIDLKKHVFDKKIPFIGICFAHQMLAHIHGARVGYLKAAKQVRFAKHNQPREIELLDPKIRALFARIPKNAFLSGNRIDQNFQEILEKILVWPESKWQTTFCVDDWKRTSIENRVHDFIETYCPKHIRSKARHEQEVHCIKNTELTHAGISNACTFDALRSNETPIFGFQTHPEDCCASYSDGEFLLRNFLYLCHVKRRIEDGCSS